MTRLGVLLLLGLAACSAPQAPSTEKCDFWCKRDRTEASLLKPGQVQRRGDQLILTLQSGKRLTLTDYERGCEKTGYDDSCGSYYLTQVNGPGRAYVVHKSFYEGFYYYLIDIRSGRQIQLEGEPVFSPQGDRFLVSPNDYFGEPKNNL